MYQARKTKALAALELALKEGAARVTVTGPTASVEAERLRWSLYYFRKRDSRFEAIAVCLQVHSATEVILHLNNQDKSSEVSIDVGQETAPSTAE